MCASPGAKYVFVDGGRGEGKWAAGVAHFRVISKKKPTSDSAVFVEVFSGAGGREREGEQKPSGVR